MERLRSEGLKTTGGSGIKFAGYSTRGSPNQGKKEREREKDIICSLKYLDIHAGSRLFARPRFDLARRFFSPRIPLADWREGGRDGGRDVWKKGLEANVDLSCILARLNSTVLAGWLVITQSGRRSLVTSRFPANFASATAAALVDSRDFSARENEISTIRRYPATLQYRLPSTIRISLCVPTFPSQVATRKFKK